MPRKRRSNAGRKKPAATVTREPEPEEEASAEEEETVPDTETTATEEESQPDCNADVSEEMLGEEEEEQQDPVEDRVGEKQEEENSSEEIPAAVSMDNIEVNGGDDDGVEEPVAGTSASTSATLPSHSDGESLVAAPGDFISQLMTDKQLLFNVELGYGPEQNLKHPLKNFTAEDEVQLFPVIETMSAKLFTIVQKMLACHKKDVDSAMKLRKGILKIPNNLIKAYLCQIRHMEKPEPEPSTSKRTPHPFLLTEDENMFSEEKLKMLRAVLDAGWKREVVMRSSGATGRKTGDVYYYSPEGVKFRSSKQVAQHLAGLENTPFTIENFSFAKVRISHNPDQEIVRKAYDGKSPPRQPPKPGPSKVKSSPTSKPEVTKPVTPRPSTSKELTENDSRSPSEETVASKGIAGRRSIQPPKRYSGDAVLLLSKRKIQDDKRSSNSKGLMQMGMLPPKYPKGMEDTSSNSLEAMEYDLGDQEGSGGNSVAMKEIAEDSLFQISALRQSGGIDVDSMSRYVASQKQLAQKIEAEADHRRAAPGSSKRGDVSVICSIRCPGMDGVVPNLQCTRCLCLFHAECLGLPPNLIFNKYVCSNCTDQNASTSTITMSGPTAPQQKVMKKPGETVKRQPPGLAPIPHGGVRRTAPQVHHRDLTVTLAGKEYVPVTGGRPPPQSSAGRGMMTVRGRGHTMMHHSMRPVRPTGYRAHPNPNSRIFIGPPPVPMKCPDLHSTVMVNSSSLPGVKRGRGRPPAVPPPRNLPQISKSVSIQSLPRVHGPPPVPNLQPMGVPKPIPSKLQMPSMSKSKPAGVPSVPNLMKSSAFRLTVPPPNLSGRTFKKQTPQAHHPTSLRLNPSAPTMIPRPPHVVQQEAPKGIKRYAQSICTIGGKKYVVLPKRVRATTVTAVGNGGVSRNNYTIVEGSRNSEVVTKRIETLVKEQQETSCNDEEVPQNSSNMEEEQDGQGHLENEDNLEDIKAEDEAPYDEIEGDGGMPVDQDGVDNGLDVEMNSNENEAEAVTANQAE